MWWEDATKDLVTVLHHVIAKKKLEPKVVIASRDSSSAREALKAVAVNTFWCPICDKRKNIVFESNTGACIHCHRQGLDKW